MKEIGFRGPTAYAPGRQKERPAGPEHPGQQTFGGLDELSSTFDHSVLILQLLSSALI